MNLLDKRIPTILAVIFLVIGVIVTSVLVEQGVIVFQHAAPSDVPQNLRVTNISDSSFTVTYTTDARVIGTISLSGGSLKSQVILDERDEQSGVPHPYTVHSISAKNLLPNTVYAFTILSSTTKYLDGDKPFSLTTPSKLSETPTQQIPLAGKILLPDGTKPTEAILFVTAENGQMLSTLLNSAGLYILPLNTMRTKDLSQTFTFNSDTKLQILAMNSNLTSHVVVGVTGINPLAPITLSQNYDFTLQTTPLATGSASTNFPILSFSSGTLTATPQIITPKDNQSFTDQQPQFQGTGSPNSTITISIHSSSAVNAQVTTDSNGNWTYRPSSPLSPGQHTITVTAPDKYGILHTLTQNFVVFAAGSQVSQSATPSATLTPTKTPVLSPAQATPTPTIFIPPTATPTLIPTPTSFAGLSSNSNTSTKPTPRPTLPPTGSNTVTIGAAAGIATTVIGIILFLVTSGGVL